MVNMNITISDAEYDALYNLVYNNKSRPDITISRFVQELIVHELAKRFLEPTNDEVQGMGHGI